MGGKSDSVMERVIEYCRLVDREFKLKRVILFGSRCRGDFYPQSDIDLLLISVSFLMIGLQGRRDCVFV